MMLVPLATGAVVASRSQTFHGAALALFALAAISLFWLRTPLEAWLRISAIKAQTGPERALTFKVMLVTAAIAIATAAALLASGHARGLLLIGMVAALAFAAQAAIKKLGRKGRMPAQVIGAIGLTSTAAGAYYVAAGRLDQTALALWVASWLFAGDQIHFVQLRIHGSRVSTFHDRVEHGLGFLRGQIVLIAAILAGCRFGMFPAAITLGFLPVLLRGVGWFLRSTQPLDVHRLGFTELAQSLIFGALLVTAFVV